LSIYQDYYKCRCRVKLLEKNYRVYIDWVEDPQTDRQNVTLETAKLLKERMNSCKSLIFVDSTNSIESKWTPWELGYFDAKKEKVAIFPVLDNEPIYRGREYMKLYPYIVQVNNILYLHDPPILLKDWIEVSTNE